jgi:hypothetical protein
MEVRPEAGTAFGASVSSVLGDLLVDLAQVGSSKRSLLGVSGEKLGKLVSDLSLAATLLAELPAWLRRLRPRGPRTVALRLLRELRWDASEVLLCWETDRWRGDGGDASAASMAVAIAGPGGSAVSDGEFVSM